MSTLKQLHARALRKDFAQGNSHSAVLRNVSISFAQGNTYAIMGVSGSGKSTLLHLLAGLDAPTSGHILCNNTDLAQLTPAQKEAYRNKTIGLLFQRPYVIKELSVVENVMLAGLIEGKTQDQCIKKAMDLLHAVGLPEKAHHKPASLSGGQQQRVALARALFNEPAFLLADEPTGNLDAHTGTAIIDLLIQLSKQWNMGLIIATHDKRVSERMNTCFQLHEGHLTEKTHGNVNESQSIQETQ